MNLVSSVGLFAYATSISSVPFMCINAVWGIVSGIDVARYLLGRHRPHKRHKPRLD
ncbi:MAG: hypothetical protein ACREGH_01910 [Minisyncoccia bacterium]